MLWTVLSLVAFAAPQPAPIVRAPNNVRIVGRAVAEVVDDTAIASVYDGGGISFGVGVVAPIFGPLSVDAEVTYRRLGEEEGPALNIVPISVLVTYSTPGALHGFVGLGPAVVVFNEVGGSDAVSGARIAAEIRGGLRLNSGLVVPTMAPNPNMLQAVELEISVGRRFEKPGEYDPESPTGFRLGAWRAGVGAGLRF